jgi:hypothetical protein
VRRRYRNPVTFRHNQRPPELRSRRPAGQPFDLEGRPAVVFRRAGKVVAVVRLDDHEGRILHVHTVARPSLAC